MSIELVPALLNAGPVWGAMGVLGGAVMTFLGLRYKTRAETAQTAYKAVQEANQHLVDSLFKQIENLKADVADMRRQVAECEVRHQEAQMELAEQRAEVARLSAHIQAIQQATGYRLPD